ncbi:rRNA methyltransferase 3, mitochondrial-like [Physella acuta]|uniref:rRNA methyltransferase 3, mitochondrial-like n=1 Tax=Physella acuta TaxID=109671 RepID=UPI0027DE08D5|nr:rRNA methyltransferase 3, mitochondrial-like [Physella acuta]
MAASITRLSYCRLFKVSQSFGTFREDLRVLNNAYLHISSVKLHKVHSQKKKKVKPMDPRKNTQYPYFPGDPVQEDAVKTLNNEKDQLFKLNEVNKKVYEQKLHEISKHSAANALQKTPSGLMYETLKEGDARLGRTVIEAKSTGHNKTSDLIVLEGQRLIKDALKMGAKAKCIYFCEFDVLDGLTPELLQDVNLYKILYRDMKVWSDTKTPSGILGLFDKPQPGEVLAHSKQQVPITLIFDSLKDPGNAGTLIRTAAAVGCERIITTTGSVNVWEGKVIRSAMGGHFCVPIYSGLSWSEVHNYVTEGTQVFLANSRPSHILERSFDQQMALEDLQVSEDLDLSDSDNEYEKDNDAMESEMRKISVDKHAEDKAYPFHNVPLVVSEYSDIKINFPPDQGRPHVALVVGGETEGLSALAKRFAFDHYGQYVTIPMTEFVNSLNTGIAGSIILYELRKKLLK